MRRLPQVTYDFVVVDETDEIPRVLDRGEAGTAQDHIAILATVLHNAAKKKWPALAQCIGLQLSRGGVPEFIISNR